MSNDEQILRYIDAAIEAKLDKMRMKVTELSGRGHNTVISSRGDIILQPGEGHRAIYKESEIGSGSGGSGSVSGTVNTLAKFTPDTTSVGNSRISDPGSGAITIASNDTYLYAGSGSCGLKFYSGAGVKGEIYPFSGATVNDFLVSASNGNLYLAAIGDIYCSDPIQMSSNKIMGLAAGTTNGDAVRYEQVLLLIGGTMAGNIAMGSNKLTGLAAGSSAGDSVRYEQFFAGTANAIPKYASTTSIGNSQLYDDGTYVYLNHDTISQLEFTNAARSATFASIHAGGSTTTIGTDGTNGGDLTLYADKANKSIKLETETVTRLTVNATAITAAVPLAMGTKEISGTADVLPHASLAHSCGSMSYPWLYVWTGALELISPDTATTGTIEHSNAEEMVFTVAAGGKFKFVVS